MGILFGRKFDKKKYESLLLNPQNLEDFDPKRIELMVESLILIAEKNFIVYQESK